MKLRICLKVSILLIFVTLPIAAFADALIVSQAMFASTIAEYFVEEAAAGCEQAGRVLRVYKRRTRELQRSGG